MGLMGVMDAAAGAVPSQMALYGGPSSMEYNLAPDAAGYGQQKVTMLVFGQCSEKKFIR